MRRTIKDKLTGILDDSGVSNTVKTLTNSHDRQLAAEHFVGYVREKGGTIVSTVQESVASMTDTTGALAKQKLLQRLFASGAIQSGHIRLALQIGLYKQILIETT
jgi:hypothetical protein